MTKNKTSNASESSKSGPGRAQGPQAVIYARVSPKGRQNGRTGPQAASDSLREQLEIVRRYCHAEGYQIAAEYHDEFLSGDDETRPGLWEAVDRCGPGTVLVVWKRERLARSVFLQESIRRELDRKGSAIVAVDGHNGDSPEDDLVRGILSYVAEYERKLAAKRTQAHMLSRQAGGRKVSSQAPMGCDIQADRLIPCEEELDLMRKALKLRLAGDSWRAIARQLNHQGVEFRGRQLNHSALHRGLTRWVSGQLPIPGPEGIQPEDLDSR